MGGSIRELPVTVIWEVTHETTISICRCSYDFGRCGKQHGKRRPHLRIPLASAFTGPYVDFGERLFNQGAMPAVAVINAAGGINGHKLDFYKMDVRFPDTQVFLSDLRRECAKPEVPMIFGIGATKTTIAALEILKKCKIPAFNPTSGGACPFPDFAACLFR